MTEKSVGVVVEGASDVPIVRRLVEAAGLGITNVYITRGKDKFNEKLPGYLNAARFSGWVLVRDLDHDAPCAPDLVASIALQLPPYAALRIAVRDMESWLLADHQAIATALAIPEHRVPTDPDLEDSSKATLVNLARSSSSRTVRSDLVPSPGNSSKVGRGYLSFIDEFALEWDPDRAAGRSESLRRALQGIRRLARTLP